MLIRYKVCLIISKTEIFPTENPKMAQHTHFYFQKNL